MVESKLSVKKEIDLLNRKALCLVEFSHASLKKSQNKIKFEVFKGDFIYQKQKRILVASTERLVYLGSNDERESFSVTSTVLKLAILNKRTNRMKLYDVDYFVLKPVLKCNLTDGTKDKSRAEQNENLALEFGSKTKKRSINSRLKFLSGGNDSIDESLINQVSQNAVLDAAPPAPAKPPSDEIIPPQNKNATNVAEVYNIFDIISQEEYHALDSVDLFKDVSLKDVQIWKKDAKYSDIIIHYLEAHFQNLSHDNAKLLCYLHYMMCFMRVSYKDWRKKDPITDVPEPFKTKMMSRYVLNKTMPQRMKDKLLADAIVLYLNISNFYIDSKLLAASTKIAVKRLVSIAYALGCHVHSSKNDETKRIELKLPLYKYVPFGKRK